MTRHTTHTPGGISRRGALKAGIVTASGVSLGGTATGTAGALRMAESKNIVPVHHFVRPEGTAEDEPVAPMPAGDDLLVERTQGLPVDDGTDPDAVDGDLGLLTWNQFSDIEGRVRLKCLEKGTHVSLHLRGLVPGALYTAWVVVFDDPGFIDTRDLRTLGQHLAGFAPLGKNDGSENVFRPSATGEAQITAIDRPAPWPNGPAANTDRESEHCLLDEYELHIIGGYHLDGQNQGSQFRPNAVEQFAFIAKNGEFL